MSKESSATKACFNRLTVCVDRLLAISSAGQWEDVVDIEQDFLGALEDVAASGKDAERFIAREEIAILQQKLQRAMHECSERRNQIAPFINALSENILNPSDKP